MGIKAAQIQYKSDHLPVRHLAVHAVTSFCLEQGLTTRSLLVAMPFGGLYGISKRLLDARRPLEMTPELAEEMLIPYRPEIPLAFEDFINYNQTVYGIRSIKTA